MHWNVNERWMNKWRGCFDVDLGYCARSTHLPSRCRWIRSILWTSSQKWKMSLIQFVFNAIFHDVLGHRGPSWHLIGVFGDALFSWNRIGFFAATLQPKSKGMDIGEIRNRLSICNTLVLTSAIQLTPKKDKLRTISWSFGPICAWVNNLVRFSSEIPFLIITYRATIRTLS